MIENKNLGTQDFSLKSSCGSTDAQAIGTLPYAGTENEMVMMTSYGDTNTMLICWSWKNDFARFSKKSLQFIE